MKDVKITLAALWVARMLSGFLGDVLRFTEPGILEQIIAQESDVPITNESLLLMALIMTVPIAMVVLSVTLKDTTSRRTNMIIGIFFVLFDLTFLMLAIFFWQPVAYEIFLAFVYLAFTSLVVWYAWKWRKQEGLSKQQNVTHQD